MSFGLAASMMLALTGCGAASTDTSSSSDAASVSEVNTNSAEGSFTYKDETFSIFDDLQSFLSKIFAFSMITINNNGTESTSAHGEPTFKAYEGKFYFYNDDKYVTSFDIKDGKVFAIYYYTTDYYNSNVKLNL